MIIWYMTIFHVHGAYRHCIITCPSLELATQQEVMEILKDYAPVHQHIRNLKEILDMTRHETCMGYYGLLWLTMGYYGLLWVIMGYCTLKPGLYGPLWVTDWLTVPQIVIIISLVIDSL